MSSRFGDRDVLGFMTRFDERFGTGRDVRTYQHTDSNGREYMPMIYESNSDARVRSDIRHRRLPDRVGGEGGGGGGGGAGGGGPGFTPRDAEDIDMVINDIALANEVSYDQWFARQYDLSNPAALAVAQKPGKTFFDRAERTMMSDLDLAERIAKINLFGVRNEEDALLKYALETQPDLARGPIERLSQTFNLSWLGVAPDGEPNPVLYEPGPLANAFR